MEEVVQLLSWYGAFGLRAHETRETPLLRMLVEDARLSPLLSISEDTANGVAANFQSAGFVRPDSVPLIVDGAYADTLVSPRSAKEYGVPTNGATDGEYPLSVAIAPGTLRGRRDQRGVGHRPVRREPVVHELLRPGGLPHDRHDPVRDVLGGATARSSRRSTCCASTTPPTTCSVTSSSV